MALEVLGVANLYTIEPLKRICVDLIKSSLTVANVASILHQADMYGVLHLRTTCINFMVANFGVRRESN